MLDTTQWLVTLAGAVLIGAVLLFFFGPRRKRRA
jgi:hypothetical protein